MNKCSNPVHPHCTLRMLPGDTFCDSGHAQVASEPSFDSIGRLSPPRPPNLYLTPQERPHLHVSGFDPRAAGGRQAIKIELRAMAVGAAPKVLIQLRSDLIAGGDARHEFVRTLRGDWMPVYIEFSSRGMEHGQYQVTVEITSQDDGQRWACTMVLLVPRADATLTEIHQTFMSTHKNVRVIADDASISRVNAQTGGPLDIDIISRNASVTHLNLAAAKGKVNLGFSTIAWDENLIEIDAATSAGSHPCQVTRACLVSTAPDVGAQRRVRLFALAECVLGRWEARDPEADVLLTHFGAAGQDYNGLTRRLSGRHAIIRRGRSGFEIEDVSRFGLLIDGTWPGKNAPVVLQLGMRIELTASIKGVVVLSVTALLPHGVVMHRVDQGEFAECFYVLEPEGHPGFPLPAYPRESMAVAMPMLFHRSGGFWHLDPETGVETAMASNSQLERLCQFQRDTRFVSDPEGSRQDVH